MRWVLRVSLTLCAALALPASASAQASFTAQDRSLTASSQSHLLLWALGTHPFPPNFDPPTASVFANHADAAHAPGFGGFDAAISSPAPLIQGLVGPAAFATSQQRSSLATHRIRASGSTFVDSDAHVLSEGTLAFLNFFLNPPVDYNFGVLRGGEAGESQFSVSFTLSEATPFHLVGSVAVAEGLIIDGTIPLTTGFALIDLSSASVSAASVLVGDTAPPYSDSLDATGTLAPGSYTLRAESTSIALAVCSESESFTCYSPTTSGSYELTLTLGTPEVPGPTRPGALLLALALAATGWRALRRGGRTHRSRSAAISACLARRQASNSGPSQAR